MGRVPAHRGGGVGLSGIRPLERADLERVQWVERDASVLFEPLGMDDIAADDPPDAQTLASYEGRSWVAEADGEVAGYVLVDVVDGAAHIEQVTVARAYAGQRIGAGLIDHVADWAAARGMTGLTLTTFADVPWNRPYYERLGFAVVSEADWGPELRALVGREQAHGLWRWPRVVMARRLVTP